MQKIKFFESGKERNGTLTKCENCGKEFPTRLSKIKKCCSFDCSYQNRRKRIQCKCTQCGKEFEKTPSKHVLAKHGFVFCSRECKDIAQSLVGNCPGIRPSHFGTAKLSYDNSLTDELIKDGCVDCGKKISWQLELHHKDGDRTNNALDNLECVCLLHHAKRHLRIKNEKWEYLSSALTPRDILSQIEE